MAADGMFHKTSQIINRNVENGHEYVTQGCTVASQICWNLHSCRLEAMCCAGVKPNACYSLVNAHHKLLVAALKLRQRCKSAASVVNIDAVLSQRDPDRTLKGPTTYV